MTATNTPANGGQILTDERIVEILTANEVGDCDPRILWHDTTSRAPTDVMRAIVRAIEADLRASLAAPASSKKVVFCPSCNTDRTWPCGAAQCDVVGSFAAPAIPAVDRNAVLDDAMLLISEYAMNKPSELGRVYTSIRGLIALKSAAPARVPHEMGYPTPTDLVSTAYANGWNDCRATVLGQIPDDPTNSPAVAQPAAQVAVSEPDLLWDASDPEDGTHGDSPANFAENYASNCMSAGDVVTVDVLCATRSNTRQMHIAIDPDPEAENWLSWKWATPATVKTATKKPLKRCAASRDGDCTHTECPQLRDNEPHTTGRHCPIDTSSEDEQ